MFIYNVILNEVFEPMHFLLIFVDFVKIVKISVTPLGYEISYVFLIVSKILHIFCMYMCYFAFKKQF